MVELSRRPEVKTVEPQPVEPVFTGEVRLECGEFEVTYPKGFKVEDVYIKGMRNRMIKLRRVPWEDINLMVQSLRGMPSMWAVEYKERKVRVWPAAINGFDLVLKSEDEQVI